MLVIVLTAGELRAIYSDDLLPYIERLQTEFGLPDSAIEIRRASHVEPTSSNKWYVNLTPIGGPVVYVDARGRQFETRQLALDYELEWLKNNWLNAGDSTDACFVTEAR